MPQPEGGTGQKIFVGSVNPGANTWKAGLMGESAVLRKQETGGSLKVGLWRTSASGTRCNPDGSCLAAGNAPVHDAVLVLEGSGTITIRSTGTTVQLEPGLIVSHPQGIDSHWDIDGPYLKKLFIEWDRTDGSKNIGNIHVARVADNPDTWRSSKWDEPSHGSQQFGESYLIRKEPAPDFALVGMWRSGVGVGAPDSGKGRPVRYSGVMGDTTVFLLEGRARVHNHETGEDHEFKSGDVIGLAQGQRISWENATPFVKAFFVVTKHVA